MIETTVANWHAHLKGQFPGGLDALLADDCVFFSPIVFTPQHGKELTKRYLMAASMTFPGDVAPSGGAMGGGGSSFHYGKEILSGTHAVWEFETSIGGKYVNGIDMITCDDEGKIIEFKVMIRPLQAVNLIHEQMKAMLEKMA